MFLLFSLIQLAHSEPATVKVVDNLSGGVTVRIDAPEHNASAQCDSVVRTGLLQPTVLPDGTVRFVCRKDSKSKILKFDTVGNDGWSFHLEFDEILPDALMIGGEEFYRARIGKRWYAVWGTTMSDPHDEVLVDFECDNDSWTNDVGGLPTYLARDDNAWRAYVWGRPAGQAHTDKPDVVCGWKKDHLGHYTAEGCPQTFPYCTVP